MVPDRFNMLLETRLAKDRAMLAPVGVDVVSYIESDVRLGVSIEPYGG